MLKSFTDPQNVIRFFGLLLILLWVAVSGCNPPSDKKQTTPTDPINSAPQINLAEGSGSQAIVPEKAARMAADSGGDGRAHPDVKQSEKIQRKVIIPESVVGKWKAVKVLVRNKADEGKNEIKTVPIGSSFQIGDTGIKVTVVSFLPNFVMDQGIYTSMNNRTSNPAVQLVVEENGKVLYKGWTFAKYPDMYSFQHNAFALELKDYIPEDVS